MAGSAERPPLSVFVIAYNEADRIGPTLAAAATLTDDLVVVDSHSTDATVEIARRHGARVECRTFDGYGAQKRYAQSLCRHPWVLALDADEVMGPGVVAEIKALFADGEPPCDAYWMRFAETFPGEATPKSYAHCNDFIRLYRKSQGEYSLSTVHDVVELKPGLREGRVKAKVAHFSIRSLADQLAKLNSYTTRQAEDLAARGRRLSVLRLPFEFAAGFCKAYFLRRHILRGRYGFLLAMNYAIYRYLRLAKHVERRILDSGRK
jgi:glycosyltransferase involved in cell wall biosynthesis